MDLSSTRMQATEMFARTSRPDPVTAWDNSDRNGPADDRYLFSDPFAIIPTEVRHLFAERSMISRSLTLSTAAIRVRVQYKPPPMMSKAMCDLRVLKQGQQDVAISIAGLVEDSET